MKRVVLDSSTVVAWVLRAEPADRIDRLVQKYRPTLHAPHVIDLEVINTLRKVQLRGLPAEQAFVALTAYLALPLTRYPHDRMAPRIWELRDNVTAYDASYIALAETLKAPLLTLDARLARSFGHHAKVELVG